MKFSDKKQLGIVDKTHFHWKRRLYSFNLLKRELEEVTLHSVNVNLLFEVECNTLDVTFCHS